MAVFKTDVQQGTPTATPLSKLVQHTAPTIPQAPEASQPSTLSKVGNWFEGEAEGTANIVKDVGEGFVQGAEAVGDIAKSGISALQLSSQTEMQNAQTQKIAEELNAIAQLPTNAQKKAALAKIGDPTKYIDQSDIDQISAQYAKMGISDTDSALTRFKKALPESLNAAFAITAVAGGPLEAATTGLKAISADAISGALVKAGLGEAGKEVTEGVAKTVGESILDEAGSSARVIVRSATENGTKVLAESESKKLLGKVINAGIVNGANAAVSEWAQGNNASTMQDREQYLKAIGMGFLQGAAIETVTGGTGLLKDYATSGKQLQSTISDINTTYAGVIQKARVDSLNEYADSKFDELKQANVDKGIAKNAAKTLAKSKSAMESLVGNTPVVNSYDEAAQHLTNEYGINIIPTEPGSQIESAVLRSGDGYNLTFKKGDFVDYMNQVGKAIPKVLADKGVSMSFFKNEIDSIPNSGVKEMDTPQAKIQNIVAGLTSSNAQYFRDTYPQVASSFDAIHGVVKKITPTEASQSFIRDNLPEHYPDIEHTIALESSKTVTDPVTGQIKQVFDAQKNQKLWTDVQDLVTKGKSKGEVVKTIQKTIDKQDNIVQLKTAAEKAAKDNPTIQSALDKANKAFSSIKNLDDKQKQWNQFLDTFKIPKPETTSRFDNPSPVFKESPLGEIPKEETPTQTTAESTKSQEPVKTELSPEAKKLASSVATQFEGSEDYNKESSLEEIQKAASFVADNYDQAVKVMMGDRVPEDFANESTARQYIRQAVKTAAYEKGDYTTVNLAASEHSIEASKGGAVLQASKWIPDNSPEGMIQKGFNALKEFTKSKQKDIEQGLTAIQKSLRESQIKDEETPNLIDKLTC